MSIINIVPKKHTLSNSEAITKHLLKAATHIDRICIIHLNKQVQGNFGFFQRFRKVIPVLNIEDTRRPQINSQIQVQYHGLGSCWSFSTKIVGYTLEGHWLLDAPDEIVQNEARRSPRYLLPPNMQWKFQSVQGLGDFPLYDLSTLGCSFMFSLGKFALQKNEQLHGMLVFPQLRIPLLLQIRHIDRDPTLQSQKVAGCSFEEISSWGKIQIHDILQNLPHAYLRRIQ